MNSILKRKAFFCSWMVILFAGLTLASCSGKPDLQKQMSGVWEDRLGHETVELRLSGDSKTVKISGNTYPATLDKLDKDKGKILLKVDEGNGKDELWSLTQMWEDSDRFNIVFERGEHKEVLIPKKKRS
ncbi:MAG: hypothetical protein PVG78_16105 [Desulfobacterales bacterium]